MAAVIELDHLSKTFGPVTAVNDVSLAIEPGEVIAFLGPNGAGKTTTISIMLGLRHPTRGSVKLFGLDPTDRRARSRCGVMLQESGVPGSLKVSELVDLFRSYYPHPLPADQAIAMAGLEEKAGATVEKLSGGQRQRLFFALAVCGNPEVLFLDEPTVALDVEGRREFWEGVRGFVRSGRTIVLTTHYLEEADQVADRVVVIDRGVVVADGTPEQIKARVAGKRVRFDLAQRPPDDLLAGLPAERFATTDLAEGVRVSFLSNEPEVVLAALFARGAPLRNLEVVGAGLEEAFLSITGQTGGEESRQ
jgi:ABC-2 type transport system ATP-binding protein